MFIFCCRVSSTFLSVPDPLDQPPEIDDDPIPLEDVYKSFYEFDFATDSITHSYCQMCRSVSQRLRVSLNKDNQMMMCESCKRNKYTTEDMKTMLPIWEDEMGTVHYDLPKELQNLHEAEKLLIAPYLMYIPLHHLEKGQLGCRGHVCCFEQDIKSICKVLPRLPTDTKVLCVIKKFRDSDDQISIKNFNVRRQKILEALNWLCKYSKVFKEEGIIIDSTRLDWMDGEEEASLPIATTVIDIEEPQHIDNGPSFEQRDPLNNTEGQYTEEVYGSLTCTTADNITNNNAASISVALQQAFDQSSKKEIDWPYVTDVAVSEYSVENLFPKAFPWLFPGGVGDFLDYRFKSLDVSQWAKQLLLYEDGRFAKDKMWGFYTLNYRERRKNQGRGTFYVNKFSNEKEKTVEEIVEEIKKGKSSWIEKISYFSSNIKGSAGYWRQRRNEIYSWISHHVEKGHGAPTFFITLSCAEYWWSDIKRLIKDRFTIAGLCPPDLENQSQVTIINEYTLIVQEYFQLRVQAWLETVGKTVFKIKHHWLRYEFAPSRGQIHAHMLAISDFRCFFGRLRMVKDETRKAKELATWARRNFGYNCTVDMSTG